MSNFRKKEILIGWPEHHVIWIEAAMTLPKRERVGAYKDIASMTGRSVNAVRAKAYWIGERRHTEMLRAKARALYESSQAKHLTVVAGKLGVSNPVPASFISAPSKARLMGCR